MAETVLGSFDFGIMQIGWNGKSVLVTDLWLEHAAEGIIDLEPGEDPWLRPWRTQARARKIHQKLGWKIGPLLTNFLRKRAEEEFILAAARPTEDRLMIAYKRARPLTSLAIEETQQCINPSKGPDHLLEIAYS